MHAVAKIRRPGIERQIGGRPAHPAAHRRAAQPVPDRRRAVRSAGRSMSSRAPSGASSTSCARGASASAFQRIFAHDPSVRAGAARVLGANHERRCLTLELMVGAKISEIAASTTAAFDRAELARRGADMVLKTVFVHGVFHGDPHPGNILVSEDGVLQLIDFGIVGYLDDVSRRQLLDLMAGFVRRDTVRVMDAVLAIGRTRPDVDLRALRFDVHDLIESYHSLPLNQVRVAQVIRDLITIVARHQIEIPADLAVLAKVLVELDGLGRRLDPHFNMVEHVKPFVRERIRSAINPENIARELLKSGEDLISLLRALPGDLHRVLTLVKENRLEFGVVHRDTDPITSAIRKAFLRLAGGVFATGLIVGATVLIAAKVPPLIRGFSIPGLVLLVGGGAIALRGMLKRDA
ncbi:MAG: AarF/UbiB family protein [Planctomycetota bacterium]